MEELYNYYSLKVEEKKDFNFLTNIKMTACLACLFDKGKGIILAADNKTTHNLGNNNFYELESEDNKKIHRLTDTIYVLCAGSSGVTETLSGVKVEKNDTAILVSKKIQQAHFDYINDLKLVRVLKLHGFSNWQDYLSRQSQLHPIISDDINRKFNANWSDCFFIVAEFNATGTSCIFSIGPDCIIHDQTRFGFATIGSGSQLAYFSLLTSEYDKNLSMEIVKDMVEKAMKDASHAPGVGKLGELITLS